jgi:multidrug transporter EmrE-like cation transporter
MNPLWTTLSTVGFIAAQAGAALLFKAQAGEGVYSLRWWLFFAAGNAVGFGCPLALAVALRGTNANLVYALCYGGGFCLVQLATWWFFREPLSAWQWSGVGFVFLGLILLQVR